MSEPFFPEIEAVTHEGPDSENPVAYRFYDAERSVLGKSMREQLRFSVCYWHSFCWPGDDVFGAGVLRAPLVRGRDAPGARGAQAVGRIRALREAGRPLLHLSRSRPRPRRPLGGRDPVQPGAHDRKRAGRDDAHGSEAALGDRQPLRTSPLRGGCGHQPRSGGLRLRRRTGEERDGGDSSARRRELRALGRPGGIRHSPQYRSATRDGAAGAIHADGRRAQAQDRLSGHDPDRAQADGADQAPVRLRCGGGIRLPAEVRSRWRDQAQHRGQSRDPGGAQLPARAGLRPRQRPLWERGHQPRRPSARLGHRPVPQQSRGGDARPLHDPARRRSRHRRIQLRREASPAEPGSRSTSSTPTSAGSTPLPAVCWALRRSSRKVASPPSSSSVTRAGTVHWGAKSWRESTTSRASPSAYAMGASIPSRSRVARSGSRTW